MSKRILLAIAVLASFLCSTALAGKYDRAKLLRARPICGNYFIESEAPITFNGNETRLICGDPNVPAWQKIPESQARYNLKNFLQARGFNYPNFRKEEKKIVIDPGECTRVKEIVVEGDHPKGLKMSHKRKVKNKPLTPSLLSTLNDWTASELRDIGYPCNKVDISAEAYSGRVILNIDSGKFYNFPPVTKPELKEMDPEAFRRFDAFETGKPFNQQLLDLTTRRIEEDGIAQNAYFVDNCTPDGVEVVQKVSLGKPHLFIVGVGADTEEYIKGKVSWKHTRLDNKGSSVNVTATASYRLQKLDTTLHWYTFKAPTRWNLAPSVFFERRNETKFNYLQTGFNVYPNYKWDNQSIGINLNIGPQLSLFKTYRGANRDFTRYLSGYVEIDIASHDYEFFNFDPRSGFILTASGKFNSKYVLSDVSAQTMKLYGQWLWNVSDLDPPLLIVGVKGMIGTTVARRSDPNFGNLPPEFLFYLGGDADLRGFHRLELPITYTGALTSAFTSFELRLLNTIPAKLEPIVFADIGILGVDSMNFDYPAYWSPGAGLRLFSMIGVFRTTVSHGFMIKNNDPANDPASHWQFFLSYGQEF